MSLDYPILRSNFLEETLLRPWCNSHIESQIILLGAGLDIRAYRFKPLQFNYHIIFEIDFPVVLEYKKKILQKEQPLCKVIRISADLLRSDWIFHLLNRGFSKGVPSFWILEGLAYYLEKDEILSLITKAAELSKKGSQIFIDISKNHKWGLNLVEIPEILAQTGWEVSNPFENDQILNQNGMLFIQGIKII
jgi:methyltransferase (TIGR00027 family)